MAALGRPNSCIYRNEKNLSAVHKTNSESSAQSPTAPPKNLSIFTYLHI